MAEPVVPGTGDDGATFNPVAFNAILDPITEDFPPEDKIVVVKFRLQLIALYYPDDILTYPQTHDVKGITS